MLTAEYLIYLAIILSGFLLGLFLRNTQENRYEIVLLLGVTFVSECASRVLAYTIKNSSPTYHLLTPLQSLLWGFFFWKEFKSKKLQLTSCLLSAFLFFYSLTYSFFIQNIFVYPDTLLQFQSMQLITLGFLLFLEKIDGPIEKNIFREQGFILSVAVIWFHLVSMIFNTFHNFLVSKLVSGATFRLINYVSNYVYYVLIDLSIILAYYRSKNQTIEIK